MSGWRGKRDDEAGSDDPVCSDGNGGRCGLASASEPSGYVELERYHAAVVSGKVVPAHAECGFGAKGCFFVDTCVAPGSTMTIPFATGVKVCTYPRTTPTHRGE